MFAGKIKRKRLANEETNEKEKKIIKIEFYSCDFVTSNQTHSSENKKNKTKKIKNMGVFQDIDSFTLEEAVSFFSLVFSIHNSKKMNDEKIEIK